MLGCSFTPTFDPEKLKDEFRKMSFYRESDFMNVEYWKIFGMQHLFIVYVSNCLSTPNGEEVPSYKEFQKVCKKDRYDTGYSFKIDLADRTKRWGNLSVRKEHRGKNVGRELVEASERICMLLGVQKIWISRALNPGFWKKMGYDNSLGQFMKILDPAQRDSTLK